MPKQPQKNVGRNASAKQKLKSPDILIGLPAPIATRLFASARTLACSTGEPLFRAGDAADGCYRLERGLLKVSVTSPQGDERILAVLGPGSIVGELALIDGQPRSATVAALRDCE